LQGDNTVDQQMYLERSLVAEQAKLAETEKYIVQLDESRTELAKLKEKQKNVGEKIDSASEKQEENSKQLETLTKRYEDENDIRRTKGAAVFNAYLAALTNTAAEINKLVDPIRKLQQQFGISAGAAARLRLEALGQSIASVVTSLSTAPVSFKEIEAAASDLRAEFGGIVSTKEAAEFAVAAKDMGVTTQQLAAARRVFMTQTMGDLAGAQSQQERFIKVFTQQGMTSKDAMEFIGKNSELLARSGTRFQQSMARAAAEAKKIGVDLSKVNQVGDNIIGNFEGFLESMAELGAMGFGFDATRLAEVAERGDTSALFDELRSQLRMTGRDLTDLTRSQQLALSNAFGMNIEDFQRMAGVTPDIGEEEKTNTFLKALVDLSERIALGLSGISAILGIVNTTLSVIHTGLLKTIAFNTSKLGVGSPKGTGIGGSTERMPQAPDAPGGSPRAPGMLDKLLQIKPSQLLAAGAAMIMISGATFILAKAMQQFSDGVNWKGVATGITSLGALALTTKLLSKATKSILLGSAAMVVMAGALWVMGKALQQFTEIEWKTVGIAVGSIAALGLALAGLGLGIKFIALGSAALVLMAGAIWTFGKAVGSLESLIPVVEAIFGGIGAVVNTVFAGIVSVIDAGASAIQTLAESIQSLDGINLVGIATGLTLVSAAIMALTGGGIAKSISNLLTGGDPIVKLTARLEQLSTATDGVVKITEAINGLSTAFVRLAETLKAIDMDKLQQVQQATAPRSTLGSVVSSVVSGAGNLVRKAAFGVGQVAGNIVGRVTGGGPSVTVDPTDDINMVDDMISTNAGTELVSRSVNTATRGESEPNINVNVDLEKLERKLDQVISAMASMQVVMDGNKVGRVMSDNEQKANTMGIFQTQRLTG
jgi:hypothetical protein